MACCGIIGTARVRSVEIDKIWCDTCNGTWEKCGNEQIFAPRGDRRKSNMERNVKTVKNDAVGLAGAQDTIETKIWIVSKTHRLSDCLFPPSQTAIKIEGAQVEKQRYFPWTENNDRIAGIKNNHALHRGRGPGGG